MATVSEILKRAKECERKGDWEGAIAEFRKMVNNDPCPPIACNLMGDLHFKKGDAAQALDWYRKAIDSYAREDLYANAIGICRKVLRQDPGREEMLERLGGLFFSQGFIREAVKHYIDYAERVAARGDSERVIETATRVREILADDPAVRERLGDVLVRVSRAVEAVGEYRAALDGFRRCEKDPEMSRVAGKLEKASAAAGPISEEAEGPDAAGGGEAGDAPAWDCGSVGDIGSAAPEGAFDPAEEDGGLLPVEPIELSETIESALPPEAEERRDREEPSFPSGVEEELEISSEETILPHPFEIPDEDFREDSRLVAFHPPGGAEGEEIEEEIPQILDDLTGSFPGESSGGSEIEIFSPRGDFAGEVETKVASGESPAPPPAEQPEDFVPVEEILREFQNGVGKILDDEDYQSHYDMGMSYKEMGLFEEALAEFEQAAASPQLRPSCGEMMGAVLLDIHRSEEAIQILRPLVDGGENDSLGIHYLLGKAYERLGQKDRALLEYRFVAERDADFRDVAERLERVHG